MVLDLFGEGQRPESAGLSLSFKRKISISILLFLLTEKRIPRSCWCQAHKFQIQRSLNIGNQKAVADCEEVIDREAMKYLGVFLYLDK